ncbi:hypothetical protein L873DRAFT_1826759 [Choiromyces venosus 120613-1]|uniref:C3H1-type domain-containing protein n=1 Tax=Choiromyces venosus 120613-1 TaxID=1336337 RepID=A0A3N4JVJ3_9PEZI|nr:hypothetical protein L873DRAFT_1826759 [Choiromyces venosus 120613-1]
MDEETWLRLNGGKLIGTNLKPPETSEEIEEWIRERRKKFPTKERVAERAKQEEERKRKLAEAYATSPPPPAEVPANQKRKRPEQDNSPDSDSDSNSTPEELTTSKRPLPSSSPRKKANRGIPCRVFQSTGRCKYGNGCRFKHAPDDSKKKKGEKEKEKKGKSGGGVKSLYQQLLEQDREKENELVVRAVRYLFEKGLLNT